MLSTRNALESIEIASNLRHESIDSSCPFSNELEILLGFADRLDGLRGKSNNAGQIDYSFHVENDRVSITERQRGAPLDRIVSELMIYANTEWARQLSDSGYAAIYRSQNNGKVRHETSPSPHQGLGVSQYAWTTSPLRRYVDLVNQRQLVAMIQGAPAPYEKEDMVLVMRDFDQAHDLYNTLQRTMER
ncbi:MAG TPA: RNB domain-containing ribonuclease, partial [Burkholderiales bacterium]|nr:RNB domain-containing ribonuclease [Burkholderiales bacterium]